MASYTYEFIELGDEHRLGCKCCRFKAGHDLPVPKKLTDEEIQPLAYQFSQSVIRNWTALNAILKRFEETIQKRWLKKDDTRRRRILLTAWPEISKTHRPDFAGFQHLSKNTPRSRTLPSNAFLWPNINLEDLRQKDILLMFMHARGRNFPDAFTLSDLKSAHLGIPWRLPEDEKANTMQFYRCRSPQTYGKIEQGKSKNHYKHLRYPPFIGLLILEIQDGIYKFLLNCAKEILHDINPTQFTLSPHQPTPSYEFAMAKAGSNIINFAQMKAYQTPNTLDVCRLQAWVGSRCASADDHAWMLREDPAYFVNSLVEWREHSDEWTLHDSYCKCGRKLEFVAAEMIADAYVTFASWDDLYGLFELVLPLDLQIYRADQKTSRLCGYDEMGWAEISQRLEFMMLKPLKMLNKAIPMSPRMRSYYSFEGRSDKWKYWWPRRKLTRSERRVDVLFFSLVNDESREIHGVSRIVQEIQHMLDTDEEASGLLDNWTISQFSEIALLAELQNCIESMYPWSQGWRSENLHLDEDIFHNTQKLSEWSDDLSKCTLNACQRVPQLNDTLDGNLDYPADKRRTKANVIQMRKAERFLDSLWKDIDGSGCTHCLDVRRLQTPRKLQRTPKWKEPLLLPGIPSRVTPLQDRDPNVPHIPGSHHDLSGAIETPKRKSKAKTRGVASPESVPPAPCVEEAEQERCELVNTVVIPKRAFKVMEALLPGPGADNHQRTEMTWEELCHALNAIGLEPEKLYGSVWMFKPLPPGQGLVQCNRSIQFHEPKEVRKGHKVPSSMVRVLGRRLKHTYGWEPGMFVCA